MLTIVTWHTRHCEKQTSVEMLSRNFTVHNMHSVNVSYIRVLLLLPEAAFVLILCLVG